MPIGPQIKYTPRWMLDDPLRNPNPAKSIRQAPPPPPPVEMKNNPDPLVGARLKWLDRQKRDEEGEIIGQALGTSIRRFGMSLLANMGPRPQGTTSLLGNIGEAIAVGAAGYEDARDRAKANIQEGRMMDALRDPELMKALNPAQQRLVQALPPAAGIQLVAGMLGDSELQKVENPAEGTLDWYDTRGNLIRRTALPQAPQRQFVQSADGRTGAVVDLTTGNVESQVDLGEADPEYNYITENGAINVMSDGELVRRIQLPSQGLTRGTPEYGQQLLAMNKDFRSLTPVKVWDETRVQVESAQQAYRNNEVYDNPAAQVQTLVAFAKILDPESVVREAEITIHTASASLADQINIMYKKIKQGGVVSKAMMDNLLLGIEEVAKTRYDNYARTRAQMTPIYEANQISGDDTNLIMGDPTEPTWMMRGGAVPGLPGGIVSFGDFGPPAADATATRNVFRYGGVR